MDTKALRQKILDLAIRGKLVPQDPNDEPASVLLERIRAEKQQLVKEGKLKAKDIKNDTIIFKGEDNLHYEKFADGTVKCIEDEIPFEIPDGWAWCRLRDIFSIGSSKRVLKSEWKSKGVPFYRAREIVKMAENGCVDNDLFISEEHYTKLKKEYGIPQAGDLMVTGVGTIGKVYIVKGTDCFYYKDASVLCFAHRGNAIISDFAKYEFDSPLIQNQIHSKTYGNTVDTITITTAENYIFALPPITEQKQIVAAIIETLELIKTINNSRVSLQNEIQILKSKILDLAIRGKLVPQDPNDEPASVLLERIRTEKEELIKQGKIKRDKKESVIFKGEDNSYYEIPSSWEWTTLNEISTLITKGTTPRGGNVFYSNSGVGFLRAENIIGFDKISLDNLKYVDTQTHNTFLKRSILKENDILITIAGTLGRTGIVSSNMLPLNTNQAVSIVRLLPVINSLFVVFAINSNELKQKLLHQEVAMAIPNLSLENISDCQLPIPPLSEQNRIVEAIIKYFSVIDSIFETLK